MSHSNTSFNAHFAPMLFIKDGWKAIEFYKKAFGAVEKRIFKNDDGSIHVAELSIANVLFHIREVNPSRKHLDPLITGGATCIMELWTADPHITFKNAMEAGAIEVNPVKDYVETGYRQGIIIDPFGHHWNLMRPL
jgi:Uncharacterized protein conserved in bacteria